MAVNQRRRFIDESDRTEGFEPSESDVQSSFGFESSSEPAPASALGEDESASGDFAEEGREKRVVVRPKAKRTAVRSKTAVRTTGAGRRSPVSENAAFSPRSEEPFSDAANQSAHNGALIQQNGQNFDAENDAQSRDAKPRLLINDLTKMSMPGLRDLAAQYGIPRDDLAPMKKQELIFVILNRIPNTAALFSLRALWKSCPTDTAFCVRRKTAICPARTTYIFRPAKSACST